MTHICVGNLTSIVSDNGLSPGRHQAIIWTNAGILLIGLLGTNFSQILIWIQTFSFKKMHSKMSSRIERPFCLGLNVLIIIYSCYSAALFEFHISNTAGNIMLAMKTSNGNISAPLALCVGNSLVTGEFHSQRPVTCNFDVFFDLPLNKQLSKQPICQRFEMPLHSLWRHHNVKPLWKPIGKQACI